MQTCWHGKSICFESPLSFFCVCVCVNSLCCLSFFFNVHGSYCRCAGVGTACLLQDHSDALSSVIVFFDRLLCSAKSARDLATRRQHLVNMLSNTGGKLAENVLLGICGQIPWRHVKDGDFSLATLLHTLGQFDVNILSSLINYALNNLPKAYANENEKLHFRNKLFSSYTNQNTNNIGHVSEIVGRFGNLTRQNYSKYRRKELAAKHAEQARIR